MENKQLKANSEIQRWEHEKHKAEENKTQTQTWNFKENTLLDFPKHVCHPWLYTKNRNYKKYFALVKKPKQNT